jgi:hypothetical protein
MSSRLVGLFTGDLNMFSDVLAGGLLLASSSSLKEFK